MKKETRKSKLNLTKRKREKRKEKRSMTWLLTWLNRSVATINATFQLLVIYKFGVENSSSNMARRIQTIFFINKFFGHQVD